MAKQVTRVVAENGREFDNAADAERYERFLAAGEAFRKAVDTYNCELAKQFKTGDGHPFTFERSDYHYVMESSYGPRIIPHEHFYAYHCRVTEEGKLVRDRSISAADRLNEFHIDQLYVSEKAAYAKLLELKQKYQQWANEEIEELKAKIEKMR